MRLHIDLSIRNSRVMSKSSDLPYTPGEGLRQCRCGMERYVVFVPGVLRIVGRSLARHIESKISLSRLVLPLIKSRVMRWKFSFPLVERRISSGSGASVIFFYLRLTDDWISLEKQDANITFFAEIIS